MQNMDNDIGLIEVADPIRFGLYVKPICLPTTSVVPMNIGKKCITIGWGYTDEDKVLAPILQLGRMKILPDDDCTTSEKDTVKFNPLTMICAGGRGKSVPSICPGDSGGPLLCQRTESPLEPWEVHGIVSWKIKDPRGLCGPTVNSFVFSKVAAFMGWINRSMAQSEEEPAPMAMRMSL